MGGGRLGGTVTGRRRYIGTELRLALNPGQAPACTPAARAARLDSLLGLPAILEKAAAGAKAAGKLDAAERLADMVCELLPKDGNGNGADGPEDERRAA